MASTRPDPALLFRDLLACIAFYTRLSVPTDDTRSLAQAQWAVPVAGALVGLMAGLLLAVCLALGLPAGIAAAITLAGSVVLTGALHEDGLADVADGFGGGRTRERKLEIMKDSRLGTYGAIALTLSLLVRWSALVALATTGAVTIALALVAAHAASRAAIPLFMTRLPAARKDGLSAGLGSIDGRAVLAALGIGAALLLPLGAGYALLASGAIALLFAFLERLARHQIGGQTGDVLGALQQGGEIALLALAAALLT